MTLLDDQLDDLAPDEPDAVAVRPEVATEPTRVAPSSQRRIDVRRVVRWSAGLMLVFIVGFALFIPTISGLAQQRSQTLLESDIRSDLANGLTPVNGPITPGTPIAVLEIDAIKVRQVVVAGSRAEQLVQGPGHLTGSALPGQPGVSVILGRRLAFGAPFRDLDRLVPGDTVTVTTGQGESTYEVVDSSVRERADASAFIGQGDMLILITGSSSPSPDERLVVRSVLRGDPFTAGAGLRSSPAEIDELGLEGDLGAAAPLLGWLQLLALVSVAGVLIGRRLGGRVAWVIAAPPVAATCVLVWENLALLFPAVS